jgi:heptosyltransferase III
MIPKTFIHHDGALGDLLLSIPAISVLRAHANSVHLAGRSDAVALLLEAGLVDEASSAGSARYTSLYSPVMTADLIEFLEGFDNAVVFTTRKESDAATSISSVLAETRIILTIPPPGVRHHVADYRLRQLPDHGEGSALAKLTLPLKRMVQAREYLSACGFNFAQPLFSIHPGSGGARKCWPVGSYLELLSKLKDWCNPFILLLSGPAESSEIKADLDAFVAGHNGAIHVNSGDLAFVAALLSMCDLHIGNDSGISHLASALDTRALIFFGPTDSVLWKPLGGDVRVVGSGVECAPCGDDNSRGCRDRKCLTSVSPERLYREARMFFPDL